MAGHAKFFAVYDSPFWRNNGLCGTAVSRKGPMAEIHDATPAAENQFVLFGFVGLNPAKRASMGEARITDSSLIHHRVHATHEGMANTHDSFRDQRRCNAW